MQESSVSVAMSFILLREVDTMNLGPLKQMFVLIESSKSSRTIFRHGSSPLFLPLVLRVRQLPVVLPFSLIAPCLLSMVDTVKAIFRHRP